MFKKKLSYFYLSIALAMLVGSAWKFESTLNHELVFEEGVQDFQHAIAVVKSDLEWELDQPLPFRYFNSEKAKKQQQALFQFNGDTLQEWSSNTVSCKKLFLLSSGLHYIENAWYVVANRSFEDSTAHAKSTTGIEMSTDRSGKRLVATQRVKTSFEQENNYLNNKFSAAIGLGKEWNLTSTGDEAKFHALISNSGNEPVYLVYDSSAGRSLNWVWGTGEAVAVIGLFLLVSCAFRYKNYWTQALAVLGMFVFRWLLMQEFAVPHLKAFKLFLPQLYADSDWIPSLGDLILHLLTFLGIYLVLKQSVNKESFVGRKQIPLSSFYQRFVLPLGLLVVLSVLGNWVSYIVHSLLYNSQMVFDVSDFSNIDSFTFVIYATLFLLFFLYYQYLSFVVRRINVRKGAVYWMIAFASGHLIWNAFHQQAWDGYVWVFVLLLLAMHKAFSNQSMTSFSIFKYFPELLIVSAFLSLQVEKKDLQDQQNEIQQVLSKKAQERDFIAEFLLQQLDEQLSNEKEHITATKEDLKAHLNSIFFSNYLKRFEIQLSYFKGTDSESILIQEGSFSPYTRIKGNLYRRLAGERIEYLLDLEKNNLKISVQFFAKEIPNGVGFPLLLASKAMGKVQTNHPYSYAKYKNGKLLEQEGVFNYPYESAVFSLNDSILSKNVFYNGFKHYLLNSNAKTYVVSQPIYELNSLLSKLSYILLLFILISLLVFLGVRASKHGVFWPQSFRGRLQYSILFILFFSTLILAYASIHFLKNKYSHTSFVAISEKIRTVEKQLNANGYDSKDSLFVEELNRLAGAFNTDINLFNAQGMLIQSTQNNIFESGLLSNQMHPVAFEKLHHQKSSLIVQIENIESMSYLSAYLPIYNQEGEIKAYLNLPYFSKTEELQSGINRFLVALINIYLLLTGLSIALALLISNRITQPLKLMRDKISRLSFSKSNEQISWNSNDEIGALVKEYNRMLSELSESANQLAQAEREGAWKEMAQQVAHEIKNPLTPMKLNIQHLEMRWEALTEQEKKKAFQRLSSNLIEQIDTLSAIATQFSNFARIPLPELVQLDLMPLVNNAVALYDGNPELVVQLESESSSCFVHGDKDQIIRVLNNLIKNAAQAISSGQQGVIQVVIAREEADCVLRVKDNGVGISEALQSKVFQPNFTTKTSGMGLGLAMVKQMLENMGGSISFESTEGEGTTFTVRFQMI